jgi:DNA-binding NtrC family response regulator
VAVGEPKPAVLVVDDEPAIRLLCRVNLELEGFRVLEASTLEDARLQLDTGEVALVLLDMRIGMERGDTLIDEVHDLAIPVVVVTGSAELDADWALRADRVLGKPFQIDALLDAVRVLACSR